MSDQLTITLSDHAAHWVHWYAEMTGRSPSQVVGDTLEDALRSLAGKGRNMTQWTDAEVLEAADSKMPPQVQSRLSELLQRLDEGTLSSDERDDLEAITKICDVENLRKASAFTEAVQRGLRERLS